MTRPWRRKDRAASVAFSHLLTSNLPPTEDESQRIRVLINDMGSELEYLVAKNVAGGREFWPWKRASLDRRVRKLTGKIRAYSSILSIVRVVPAEIIQHIFLLSGISAWTLSSICKDWRAYAHSLPRLWTRLPSVRVNPKSRKTSEVTLNKCTAMLRYSSNAPLEVRITTVERKNMKAIVNDPVLNLLVSHSARWRTAVIDLPPVAMATLTPRMKGHLACLQTLWLQNRNLHDLEEGGDLITVIDAPQLKSFHITGSFAGTFQVTAPNLTHLTCRWPLPFGFSALSQFTQLESLNLTSGYRHIETTSIPDTPMSFPHLKHLIADIQRDPSCSLLQYLTAPAVSVLFLSLPTEGFLDHLTTMLTRSGQQIDSTIRHFELRHNALPEAGQIVALLRLMPELRHLGLSMPHVDDIHVFAKTDDPLRILVPKLETCTFFFEGVPLSTRPSDELRAAIKDVVRGRCEPPFSTNSPESWDAEDTHTLHAFSLEGRSFTYVIPELSIPSQLRDLRCVPLFTQADFEDWAPTPGLQRLLDLHEELVEIVPHLYTNCVFLGRPPKGWAARVNAILDRMEAMDGINPFDLLISNLHNAVEKLTPSYTKRFDNTGRASFPQAARVLAKWKNLLAPHTGDAHWVYTVPEYSLTRSAMVYVRKDHPQRSSRKMVDAIIGKDDTLLFWTKLPDLTPLMQSFRYLL